MDLQHEKQELQQLLQHAAITILNYRVARALRHWRAWSTKSRALQGRAQQVLRVMMCRQQVGIGRMD